MTGVLIVNMGGAESPAEMKKFLSRMFMDPCILPFRKPGRFLLSFIISNSRYKKSWKKYQLIGGTPIIKDTKQLCCRLVNELGENYSVKFGFSYSDPSVIESMEKFLSEGINKILIIPQYPQYSISTTGSVENDIKKFTSKNPEAEVVLVKEFHNHPDYVEFWKDLIVSHAETEKYDDPLLIFSAHSIPVFLTEKGDTYPQAIEESAKLIAEASGMNYIVSYQSGMSRGEWLKPDTKDVIKTRTEKEVIFIPISFTGENLETLYDLNHDIIPFAKHALSSERISKPVIPAASDNYIKLMKSIVYEYE